MTLKIYGPYTRKDGRQHVIEYKKHKGKTVRRTISYPKYLLERELGTIPSDLTVDHLDRNFNNNSLSNLKLIPRAEHSKLDAIRVYYGTANCVWCERKFALTKGQSNNGSKAGPFCSRSCSGKYGAYIQNGGSLLNRKPLEKIYYQTTKTDTCNFKILLVDSGLNKIEFSSIAKCAEYLNLPAGVILELALKNGKIENYTVYKI